MVHSINVREVFPSIWLWFELWASTSAQKMTISNFERARMQIFPSGFRVVRSLTQHWFRKQCWVEPQQKWDSDTLRTETYSSMTNAKFLVLNQRNGFKRGFYSTTWLYGSIDRKIHGLFVLCSTQLDFYEPWEQPIFGVFVGWLWPRNWKNCNL